LNANEPKNSKIGALKRDVEECKEVQKIYSRKYTVRTLLAKLLAEIHDDHISQIMVWGYTEQ